MTEFNIEHIWKSVLAGDVHAWGELVRVYAALVNTVARRVGLSGLDAEDCAQHTWMSLYRNRRVIKDPQALPAWLIPAIVAAVGVGLVVFVLNVVSE